MRIPARVAVVCVMAWLLQSGIATAAEGWLDKLSGPGPFTGHVSPMLRLFCVPEKEGVTFVQGDCTALDNPRGYLAFRWTHFKSERNELFADAEAEKHRVNVDSQEFLWFAHVANPLDIGAGFGVEVFHGPGFDRFVRGSFTPVDLLWRPLAGFSTKRWTQTVSISLSTRWFFPEIRQNADGLPDGDKDSHTFCRRGECQGIRAFSTKSEYSWSTNIYIDLTTLIF